MKKYIISIALIFAISSQAYSQSEPPYGMSEIQAYSIFYENYRTGDYDMALMFGKWMLEKKPRTIQGVNRFSLPRQFERMINVYAEFSKQQDDPSMRSAYIDTALAIFDDAFETFDEEEIDHYTWHFRRGRFLQEHQGIIRGGMDKAYEDYRKAFEIDPERLTQSGDGYYIQLMLNNYVSKGDREAALEMIEIVEPMAGPQLAQVIDEVRDGLFTDPEERIEFLEARLADNPEDMALITELAALFENLGQRDKAIEYAQKIYEIEPSFENIRRLADYAKADGQNQLALRYLNEALDIVDNPEVRKNLLVEVSEIHQNEGDLQTARRYARQAIQLDSSWGQPYIRMSSIYAAAIRQCTSGRQIERDDRTVYWLVIEYLERAKQNDPAVASTVNRRIQSYEPVMPSAEDKFFRGWETGDSFHIGADVDQCYAWIDETTTVR